jgi:hypothetical protein
LIQSPYRAVEPHEVDGPSKDFDWVILILFIYRIAIKAKDKIRNLFNVAGFRKISETGHFCFCLSSGDKT